MRRNHRGWAAPSHHRGVASNVDVSITVANCVHDPSSGASGYLSPISSDQRTDEFGSMLTSSLQLSRPGTPRRGRSGTASPQLQKEAPKGPALLDAISPELIGRHGKGTDLEESLFQVCVEQAVAKLTTILERQEKTLARTQSSVPTAADVAEALLPGLIKELTPALTDSLAPRLTRAVSADELMLAVEQGVEKAAEEAEQHTGPLHAVAECEEPWITCPECGGSGNKADATCPRCFGRGRVVESEKGKVIESETARSRVESEIARSYGSDQVKLGRGLNQIWKSEAEDPDWKKLEHTIFDFLPSTALTRNMQFSIEWYMNLAEPERDGCLNRFVHHPKIEVLCVLVIIAHAGFSGYMANWELRNLNKTPSLFIQTVELAFLIWYLFELLGKLSVHRLYFFANEDYKWNLFDIFLIGMSVYDQVMLVLTADGEREDAANISFMRIFRLMKLSKIMRIFRVLRFLRDLRLMLVAIRRSFMSLVWCLILLGFILYIFALILVQGVAQYMAANEGLLSTHEVDNIMSMFGSIQTTCLSLYKAVTGGADWGEYLAVMRLAGVVYMGLFIFYTAFVFFVVMNILTAMIVENVVSIAETDDDSMLYHFQRQQEKLLQDITNVFVAIDENHDGTIGLSEFMKGLQSPQVLALMSSLEIEVDNAELFFKMLLDVSVESRVEIHSFLSACVKMKGPATSLDLQCLMWETKILRKDIDMMKRGLKID